MTAATTTPLPCWVPGIMEMMVGNKEQVEAHPEIARCFDEYTLKNMKLMTRTCRAVWALCV